ncbi:hypothetical protein BANRA_02484 [Acinetobacter baumannii]|nr:hypothetical protein BANRA_02484 [Acinetobacter baumannii]
MKTFLSIMVLICISTFLGLVIAALVAKTHQPKTNEQPFVFHWPSWTALLLHLHIDPS